MEVDKLRHFNLDYCKQFSEEKLRKMYNGESAETLDLLVAAVKSKPVHKDIIEVPAKVENDFPKVEKLKTTKKIN